MDVTAAVAEIASRIMLWCGVVAQSSPPNSAVDALAPYVPGPAGPLERVRLFLLIQLVPPSALLCGVTVREPEPPAVSSMLN